MKAKIILDDSDIKIIKVICNKLNLKINIHNNTLETSDITSYLKDIYSKISNFPNAIINLHIYKYKKYLHIFGININK